LLGRGDAVIKPALQDDAFLADVAAARGNKEGFCLWWLGQSGFLIQWQARHLLLDPYLSDSLTRKYAGTDKPHVRMTERVAPPERLDFIDVATSSHNHTDHLDADTLLPLRRVNPRLAIVAPAANLEFAAQRLDLRPEDLLGIDAGQSLSVAGFTLHAVPAAHETVDRDPQGRCLFVGYVIRFGPWTVYHSGDTVLYPGMVDLLRPWKVDVALLPINGRGPERRVAGNLWGREAARLAWDISARLVIPCHYEMFEFNTASPDEFVSAARALGQAHCVLRVGERWRATTR
jgi:L-ascorbate metabolism protein UlaG (beta-lactamase superfamily)